GTVIAAEVRGNRLIETVQWAIDVPDNKLARQGFQMVQAGHGSRVSVGFIPHKFIYPGDAVFRKQCTECKADPSEVRRIFDGQTQVELSAVLVGSNLNAIAYAFKQGILDAADLERFDAIREHVQANGCTSADLGVFAPSGNSRSAASRYLDDLLEEFVSKRPFPNVVTCASRSRYRRTLAEATFSFPDLVD
ncbi:MAG: hypothetical protein ACREUU_09675, partial [Gammaproteobacteria bacterium]